MEQRAWENQLNSLINEAAELKKELIAARKLLAQATDYKNELDEKCQGVDTNIRSLVIERRAILKRRVEVDVVIMDTVSRLTDLYEAYDQLINGMKRTIKEIADAVIGDKEGYVLLQNGMALVRLSAGGERFITKIVPLCGGG